jgi:hypothetical protein
MSVDFTAVDAFAETKGENEASRRATDFMLAYLEGMTRPMPDVARDGLGVARAFRAGSADTAALEAARVACWDYVDAHGGSAGEASPDNACVRAVICTLYDGPQKGGDTGDAIDNFLDFADVFEDRSTEAQALLGQFFAVEPHGVSA